MTTILRRSLLLLAAVCLGLILVSLNTHPAKAGVPQAPAGYVVFDRLPWDTSVYTQSRVSRTGRLYKPAYDSAGLTGYVGGSNGEYHPALGAMSVHQRAAIDFGMDAGTPVLAVADGKVIKKTGCQVAVRHSNGMVAYYIHMSKTEAPLNSTVSAGQRLGLSGPGGTCADKVGAHLHFALWNGNKEVPVAFSNVGAQTNGGKTCPANVICPSRKNYVEFRYGAGSPPPPPPPPPPTPTPPPPTTPTGPSGYAFCSWENQRCNFSGVQDVAYGANGAFAYRYTLSGGIDCNNATFGDPAYGVVKACFIKSTPPFSGNVSSALSITVTQARLDVCANNIPGRPVYATLYRGPVGSYGEKLWRFTINTPSNATCITFVDMDGAGDTLKGVTYYTVASTKPISDGDAKARRTSCFSATGGYQLCDARSR